MITTTYIVQCDLCGETCRTAAVADGAKKDPEGVGALDVPSAQLAEERRPGGFLATRVRDLPEAGQQLRRTRQAVRTAAAAARSQPLKHASDARRGSVVSSPAVPARPYGDHPLLHPALTKQDRQKAIERLTADE